MSDESDTKSDPKTALNASFGDLPNQSALMPVRLLPTSKLQFDCHPGISCFNECCKRSRVTLTPYDLIRLKNRLGMQASEFVVRYTMPVELDAHGLPGIQLLPAEGETQCPMLGENGCTVYEDRPTACRYYPVGSGAFREAEAPDASDFFFLVKEDHCKGHDEPKEQTIANYCDGQGTEPYDEFNALWNRLILKKRSAGPAVGKPSPRSLEFFFMCSFDMEGMHDFISTPSFQEVYDLSPEELDKILNDEFERLRFSFRLLDQVLYGQNTIPMRKDAVEKRRLKSRDRLAQRHLLEAQRQSELNELASREEHENDKS